MSLPWLFFLGSLVGLAFTGNALRPLFAPRVPAVVSFFAGWITGELALHHIVWQAVLAAWFVHEGALAAWPGALALALCGLSWAGLVLCYQRARRARGILAAALDEGLGDALDDSIAAGGEAIPGARPPVLPWSLRALPMPVRHGDVECLRDVVFHKEGRLTLRLDVHRRRGARAATSQGGAPAFIAVHGGAWIIGRKERQGLPLLQHLAACGWVCFNIDYRLSPRATFPDHIVDVKRAIAWVRAHAADYGVDPDFIVLGGGSAGGHLAALAALTPDARDWLPGIESADVRVQGCIPLYGIYDLTDRFHHWHNDGLHRLLERYVMKSTLADARDAWRNASPLDHVRADAPPFFVVHGDNDSLVPVAEARTFVAALRAVSPRPVVYAELPGAQHAFDIFPSRRTLHWVEAATAWAVRLHDQHRARAQSQDQSPAARELTG